MTGTLVVRDAQLRALRIPLRDGVIATLAAHATACHPDEAAALGDGLDAYLRAVIDRADQYGLVSERDLTRFLSLALTFGDDWTTPDCQWLDESLRARPDAERRGDRADASVRLHRTFQRALDRLAQPDE